MARTLLNNGSVNKTDQQGNWVSYAVRAAQKHGDVESMLPGNVAVNMHP
jgi:hypothetical protein